MAKDSQNRPHAKLSKDYGSALHALWSGRPRTCIERLSNALEKESSEDGRFRLYRLWIEVLADQGEYSTLKTLVDHFGFCIQSEEGDSHTYAALKGICHFELDEFEAACLSYRGLEQSRSNPYVWELSSRLSSRSDVIKSASYKKSREKLLDYFHITAYAQEALRSDQRTELNWVYNRIRKLYPESPFPGLLQFQKSLDVEDYETAINVGIELCHAYPLNLEFGFNLGFAFSKAGDHVRAIGEFGRINELYGDEDPDVLSWLGHSLVQQAMAEDDKNLAERAIEVLEKAIGVCESHGLPHGALYQNLRNMEDLLGKEKDWDSGKVWLLKVSSRRFHQIRTGHEEHIREMDLPLNQQAGPGDYCFVFGDHYDKDAGIWRLGALYQVQDGPIFNPKSIYENRLRLVDRPEVTIPVEIQEVGDSGGKSVCFEIEPEGLDTILNAIDEVGLDDQTAYAQLRRAH